MNNYSTLKFLPAKLICGLFSQVKWVKPSNCEEWTYQVPQVSGTRSITNIIPTHLAPSEQSFDTSCHPAASASAAVRGWLTKPSKTKGVQCTWKLYQFCSASIEEKDANKAKRIIDFKNMILIQSKWYSDAELTFLLYYILSAECSAFTRRQC